MKLVPNKTLEFQVEYKDGIYTVSETKFGIRMRGNTIAEAITKIEEKLETLYKMYMLDEGFLFSKEFSEIKQRLSNWFTMIDDDGKKIETDDTVEILS